MNYSVEPVKRIKGQIRVPGDKSISHRSIILASLAEGKSVIRGLLEAEDCLNTVKAFQMMGIKIDKINQEYIIEGKGLDGLKEPEGIIDCGNSGTAMRIMSGLLAAQDFYSVMTGDQSLSKRPMDRVIKPLRKMGAEIWGRQDKFPPLSIRGQKLSDVEYKLPVASAQVKSAILLAGLYASGSVRVIEPGPSRDHTERMLKMFGVNIIKNGNIIEIPNKQPHNLKPCSLEVPGDISSAAFFIAAALMVKNSELYIKNVGINETRSGIIDVLEDMKADIKILNKRNTDGEPVADLLINDSSLKGVEIRGQIIPRVIDEIPIIAVLAARAEGTTVIRDAAELRVKESDRIKLIVSYLKRLGVEVEELEDGMIINGTDNFKGGLTVNSQGDHRIAMSMAIAGLVTDGEGIEIVNSEIINTSFPGFFQLLKSVAVQEMKESNG